MTIPDPYPGLEPEDQSVPYTLTSRAEAVLASWDRFRALGEAERLALGEAQLQPGPMTAAEAEAASGAEAWGGRGPSASYAEWLAEGQPEPEAEL